MTELWESMFAAKVESDQFGKTFRGAEDAIAGLASGADGATQRRPCIGRPAAVKLPAARGGVQACIAWPVSHAFEEERCRLHFVTE